MKKTLIPLLILVLSNMAQAAEVDISSYTIGIEGSKTLLFGNYTTIEFSPHFEFTEYSSSQRNDPTRRFGLDSYIDYGRNHSFDLGIGLAQFTSSVTSPSSTSWEEQQSEQKDLLLIYTNKYFRKISIRCGFHNVSTDNKGSLDVNTVIAGIDTRLAGSLNISLSYYLSSYDDPSISTHQISPCLGFSFNNNRFYTQSSVNYILLSDNPLEPSEPPEPPLPLFGDKEFLSLEQSLNFYYRKLTLSSSIFMGESALAVLGNGYSITNSLTVYESGYGLGAALAFNKAVLIRLQYHRRKYTDKKLDEQGTVSSVYIGITLSN